MADVSDLAVVGLGIGNLFDESDEHNARSLPHCVAASAAGVVVVVDDDDDDVDDGVVVVVVDDVAPGRNGVVWLGFVVRTAQPARGGNVLGDGVPLARVQQGAPRPLPPALATRASSPPLRLGGRGGAG